MDESTNSIKQFFDEFNRCKTEDNVQHRSNILSSFSMKPEDVKVEVLDWCLHYLEQKKCPHSLALTLAKLVAHQLSDSVYEMSLQADEGIDDDDKSFSYKTSQLYIEMVECLAETCKNWQEYIDITTAKLEPLPHIVSVCAIKNSRRKMEDRHVILHNLNTVCGLKDAPHHSYYAIFDGHAGVEAASYCAAHLHWNIVNHPAFLTDTEKAISEAITLTDKTFLERSYREGIKGGSTALCCLIREKTLYIAWVGDSQAVLVKKGVPNIIGLPHKPDREEERCRVKELGGCVLFMDTWRVDGTLSVSRAVGDLEHKPHISSEADICKITLDGAEDYLVLACDGLWDKLSPSDLGLLVYQHITEGKSVERIAPELVQISKELGSQDNITAIVIFMKDPYNISVPPICLPSLNNKLENDQLKTTNEENYVLKSQELITDLSDISDKVISSISNIDLSTGKGTNSLLYDNNSVTSLNDNRINGNFLQNENEKNICENNNEISVADNISNQIDADSLEMMADNSPNDDKIVVSPLSNDSLISTDEKSDFSDSKQTPTDVSTFSDELRADSKPYLSDLESETSISVSDHSNTVFIKDNTSSSKQEVNNLIDLELANRIPQPNNTINSSQFNKELHYNERIDSEISNNALPSETKTISTDVKKEGNLICFEGNMYASDSTSKIPSNVQEVPPNYLNNKLTEEKIINTNQSENISNLRNEIESSSKDLSADINNCLKSKTCTPNLILQNSQETSLEHSDSINKIQTSTIQEISETCSEYANIISENQNDVGKPLQEQLYKDSVNMTNTVQNNNDNLRPKAAICRENNKTNRIVHLKNAKSVTDSKTGKESLSKSKVKKTTDDKLIKTSPAKLQQNKSAQKLVNKSTEKKSLQQSIKDSPIRKVTVQNRTNTENVFERLSMPKSTPKFKTMPKDEGKSSSPLKTSETKTLPKSGKLLSSKSSKESCTSHASPSSKSNTKTVKISSPKTLALKASKSETVNKLNEENISNASPEKVESAQREKINSKFLTGEKCLRENTTEKKSLIKNSLKTNNKDPNDKISKQNNSDLPKTNAKSEKNIVNRKLTEKHIKTASAIQKNSISPIQKNKTVNATTSKEIEKKAKMTPSEKIKSAKSKTSATPKASVKKPLEKGNCEAITKSLEKETEVVTKSN
ncbi:probable serine/threonine-protein kinase DDB_G0282963 [Centruroides sculpturatus]|uniref:probable serine/threonine-protein kinase DDB_G0282963 n=1 Tax=Centruroides sculpturatus TaxID=218467 RepID=UPI000C6DA6B4|nr:probable serine/threonine-protein kinase DDB_G0282963 [Centruroides sculpturatus]